MILAEVGQGNIPPSYCSSLTSNLCPFCLIFVGFFFIVAGDFAVQNSLSRFSSPKCKKVMCLPERMCVLDKPHSGMC